MIEQLFAIFVNNLELDAAGNATNRTQADRRAASWLLSVLDPSQLPIAPFTDEERALYAH